MRGINQDLPEGLDGNKWEQLLADLRGHMFAYGTWESLAADAKLSVSTVAKLAYGDTKSPQFLTVVKIMAALDRLDELVAVFKSEAPVSVKEAQDKRPKLKQRRKKPQK